MAETTKDDNIDIDPEYDGEPSDGSKSFVESTESLSASICEYRKIHGRTFQNFKDAEYWAPNDAKQNEGLDLHYFMTLLLHDGQLHIIPVEGAEKVLDVGTGTGAWAIDFADKYPSATVIGTDLSPIQPSWIPSNVRFEIDDASLPWTFPDASFDFIHISQLLGSIADWSKLYREAYRCLKPGGWIEHTDFSGRVLTDDASIAMDDGNAYGTWNDFFAEASQKTGRSFHLADDGVLAGWLREAGFPEVRDKKYKVPVGRWPKDKRWKEVGAYSLVGLLHGLEGYAIFLGTQVLGWSVEDLDILFAKMRKALTNPRIHAYYPAVTVYAQKPAA